MGRIFKVIVAGCLNAVGAGLSLWWLGSLAIHLGFEPHGPPQDCHLAAMFYGAIAATVLTLLTGITGVATAPVVAGPSRTPGGLVASGLAWAALALAALPLLALILAPFLGPSLPDPSWHSGW